MKITTDTVATIDYALRNQAGELVDSSAASGPMLYLHGYRHVLPALESAVEGRSAGEHLVVELEPEDAYGAHQENLVFEAKREVLPEGLELAEGKRLTSGSHGRKFSLRVVRLTDDGAILDGNHPLAGQRLTFELTIREVRAATAAEVQARRASGDTARRPVTAGWQ
ncbi:peptidylprolyl isomerase [Aquisalimonas sp. 2447]|uniref:FKBP-type peptidyl-prolyl cis-trans isomerase n=1 Tax=Aquisalimonas sp. 2447 TaxID=2740807 RepID=UPI0014323015|nr:peptidylprolyl isomerase [Aquisalimonas sp. 2447]QIT54914.1 peptidylprolyl isomerase [Aquisalimonas sp. 2447]